MVEVGIVREEDIEMGAEMLMFWYSLTLGTVYLYVYDRLHHALIFFGRRATRSDVSHDRCVVI